MLKTIEGSLTADKRLIFKDVVTVSTGENLTTSLTVLLPTEALGYRYYLEFDCNGKTYISDWLIPDNQNKLIYDLPAAVLARTGEVKVQLVAEGSEDNIIIFKSLVGSESSFYVFSSVNSNNITAKLISNALIRAEEAANNCLSIAAEAETAAAYANIKGNEASQAALQIFADKENGLFNGAVGEKGDKGDKGNPSSVDKIGTASSALNLSDNYISVYGTISNPLTISENTNITFSGLTAVSGYLNSFILYIKRTAESLVTWPNCVIWANNAIPILPVSKVQKILFETSDGITYFGTAGDYFNA